MRQAGNPLSGIQQRGAPSTTLHSSRSPSPRAAGPMCSAQGREPGSEGKSPAQGSGKPTLESSGTLHEGLPSAQLTAPQQNTLQRASPSPQPCPVVAGNRASSSPDGRAYAGPVAVSPTDACGAFPFKTSSPVQSGTVSSLGAGLPLPHSRTSSAVKHSTFPLSQPGSMPTTHEPTQYVETGPHPAPLADQTQPQTAFQHRASSTPQADVRASPCPHAQQPQPQSAFQLRASPSPRADVRASPSPHAEMSQPCFELQHRASRMPHADVSASLSPHSDRPLPQPVFQYKASPERPRSSRHGQNKMPSPVSQMMVLPSQLRLPPHLAAMTGGQVTCNFHPMQFHLL